LVEGNNPFQVAWLDDSERDDLLGRISRLGAERGTEWPEPIVFEGNVPADPLRTPALRQLVESGRAAPPLDREADRVLTAWVGDAVSITGPAEVTFARRSGANLLIVGEDADAAHGVLAAGLVALATGTRSEGERSAEKLPSLHLFTGSSRTA